MKLIWILTIAIIPFLQDDAALTREFDVEEWRLEKAFVNTTYDIGVAYYQQGFRHEAIWFFQHTSELVPKNTSLSNFVKLIQDFNNPLWKNKTWQNPKSGTEKEFRRKVAAWEDECTKIFYQMGKFAGAKKGAFAHSKATDYYIKAIQIKGGEIEIAADKRIKVGKAGSIPEPFSAEIIKNSLIKINDRLYFRDEMLKAIPDIASVQEAKGKNFIIRIDGKRERADELLAVMEQGYNKYAAHTGQTALKTLGLLVMADRAGYERVCNAMGLPELVNANGFASSAAGFAVTYEQENLIEIAVHEGAHLFHLLVFRSLMPSWYDEGFATTFSLAGGGNMRVVDGILETGLPISRAYIELIQTKMLPIRELLAGSAADRINAKDGSAGIFYAQSWALYNFLNTTKDPRFAKRFDKWESFCLGSAFEKKASATRSAELFDTVFGEVIAELVPALKAWIDTKAAGADKK